MAGSTDWSYYHRMDEQFHQLVGTASCLDTAVEVYHETLAELYGYFIPHPIEKLHTSNHATSRSWRPSMPAMLRRRWRSPGSTWTSCTGRCLWGWHRAQFKPQ